MVNLLPDTQKKIIEAEYRFRTILVSLSFFIFFLIISSALLLPAYFLSRGKFSVASADTAMAASLTKEQADEVRRELSLLNEKLSVVSLERPGLPVSAIISSVVSSRSAEVYIKNMIYESKGGTSKIDIFGTSKTRDSFLVFVENLQPAKIFSEVYSPISNLVKEKDVDFTVQIGITK